MVSVLTRLIQPTQTSAMESIEYEYRDAEYEANRMNPPNDNAPSNHHIAFPNATVISLLFLSVGEEGVVRLGLSAYRFR